MTFRDPSLSNLSLVGLATFSSHTVLTPPHKIGCHLCDRSPPQGRDNKGNHCPVRVA